MVEGEVSSPRVDSEAGEVSLEWLRSRAPEGACSGREVVGLLTKRSARRAFVSSIV